MKGLRKHFGLKNFEESHRHSFTHNRKFIGSEVTERQSLQIIMIFQFPESGFDALSFMIKSAKFSGGKFRIAGNAIITGTYFPSAVFFSAG